MRIIFMGTPTFALPTAQALLDLGHDVVAVFTQPPKPSKRGREVTMSPVHHWAMEHNLPVHTPASLRKDVAAVDTFLSYDADMAVVAAYGLLLPPALLSAPRLGCLNVHASLLPRWRGASPVHQALLHGDTHTGITLMMMDAGLDTGAMLAKASIPIDDADTTETLYHRLAQLAAGVLTDTLPLYVRGALHPVAQPDVGVTLAPLLKKSDGLLNFQQSALFLHRQIRAFTPWPTSYFFHKNEHIRILSASYTMEGTFTPGVILDDQCLIGCGSGALRPHLLQRAGKKAMPTSDFLRGFPIPAGTNIWRRTI